MKKRTKLLILIGLVFISVLFSWENLKHHSVYYAHRMKHSKKYNPELAFIIKNMDNISMPSKKGYRVDIDGIDTLIKNEEFFIKYDYEYNYDYPFYNSNHAIRRIRITFFKTDSFQYFYSDQGEYLYSENVDFKKDYSNTQRQKAEKLVTETIDPIVKAQQKPKINLQWLFNVIYTKKFN